VKARTNRITEWAFKKGLEAKRQREQRMRQECVQIPGEDLEKLNSRLEEGHITNSTVDLPY
jgi:hypothetical protein